MLCHHSLVMPCPNLYITHWTAKQCCFNVGPASLTMTQQKPNIGSIYHCTDVSYSIIPPSLPQQTQYVEPMPVNCWSSVVDGGPTINQYLLFSLCLSGYFTLENWGHDKHISELSISGVPMRRVGGWIVGGNLQVKVGPRRVFTLLGWVNVCVRWPNLTPSVGVNAWLTVV